jgi:hypothetical protein
MVNYLVQQFSMEWVKKTAILSVTDVKIEDLPKVDIYPFRVLTANYPYHKEILGIDIEALMKEQSVRILNLNSGDVLYMINCSHRRDATLEQIKESYRIKKIEVFYEEE